MKKNLYSQTILFITLCTYSLIFTSCSSGFGDSPSENRQKMYKKSPQFNDGKFHNIKKTNSAPPWSKMFGVFWDMTFNSNQTVPEKVFQVKHFDKAVWDSIPPEQFAMAWLGHSTILLKLDGLNIITDPVFSHRSSPYSFIGPKHFAYSYKVAVEDLPKIDIVILSHDHYDHLDEEVIKKFANEKNSPKFYVPLGVESHLVYWGIDSTNISTADWWDEFEFGDNIKLAFVPAQHFSGRGLTDRNATLWGSWVIKDSTNTLFFSGDSGYHKEFKAIGDKYGPFDLTFMECGAYNKEWADIHMFPEQSYQGALDLKSKVVMPIHWAKYDLSMHDWREPVERIKKASISSTVPNSAQLITPEINMIFLPQSEKPQTDWWKLF